MYQQPHCSPIIQIRGVEGAGLGGADLPNCFMGGIQGPNSSGGHAKYHHHHAIGFMGEADINDEDGQDLQDLGFDDDDAASFDGGASRAGSTMSGVRQHQLTHGFNRPPSVHEARFMTKDEYHFEKSACTAGSQSGWSAAKSGRSNYGNASRSPRRRPSYGVDHPPQHGFTRSHTPQSSEAQDDGQYSVAPSQRTAATGRSGRHMTTCPTLAHLEFVGAGSEVGSLMLGEQSGASLLKGHDISLADPQTKAFMMGHSPHYTVNQYPANKHELHGNIPRGIMPEAHMDNAIPVSYTQMMGGCPEYLLNGLTSDIMGYL